MADGEQVAIAPTNNQPTIEESHAALVAEGVISADETDKGANTEVNKDTVEQPEDNVLSSKSLDKFKNSDGEIDVEALQKSYLELEKHKSKPAEETKAEPTDNGERMELTKEPTDAERKSVEEISKKAEVNLAELSTEWMQNGELTKDHYAKLEAAGYPRELVDTYAKGLTVDKAAVANEAVGIVGNTESYGEMLDWAADNLSQSEQKAFDDAVNSNDRDRVMLAVRGLHAQHSKATDDGVREPSETLDGAAGKTSNVYQHSDEFMADLSDPRYDASEAFRTKVMNKLNRSNI